METLPRDDIDFNRLTDQAFTNRFASETDFGSRLLVEIPDEDGYAGYLEGLHALGIARVGDEVIIEADYNHSSRKSRLQDLIRLNLTTQEISFTRYRNGQTELEPADEDKARLVARNYLLEATYGTKLNAMTSTEYSFFSPELQPIEAAEDEEK